MGSIYRLPDDLSLQRGITYTIMPDGKSLRVPAMNRLVVRSQAESHTEDEGRSIVQALQNLIAGKKPLKGQARFNRHGVVQHGLAGFHPQPAVADPAEHMLRPVGGGGLEEM